MRDPRIGLIPWFQFYDSPIKRKTEVLAGFVLK